LSLLWTGQPAVFAWDFTQEFLDSLENKTSIVFALTVFLILPAHSTVAVDINVYEVF
jgi:hypothetical protein